MKKKIEYSLFAVSAPGLEEICLQEMESIGLKGLQAVPGGVCFTGDLRALYLSNLWLRSASRILVRVGEVHARDFPELYRKCLRLPWGRFVRRDVAVQVRAASHASRLFHTGRIAGSIAEAIDHALGRKGVLEEEGSPLLVLARFEEDRCTLSVDSSGELLHRRGYRLEAGAAPLRENLAAATLLHLGWRGQVPLFDPTCGSGTFLIEAAWLAQGRPPGLQRQYAFARWPGYRPGLWDALCAQWKPSSSHTLPWIGGADILASALEVARANARRAEVYDLISLERRELSESAASADAGLLVCNPPYGERIGAGEDLGRFYRTLGQVCRDRFRHWTCAFLCPDEELARQAGEGFAPQARWINGGIPVKLYVRGRSF